MHSCTISPGESKDEIANYHRLNQYVDRIRSHVNKKKHRIGPGKVSGFFWLLHAKKIPARSINGAISVARDGIPRAPAISTIAIEGSSNPRQGRSSPGSGISTLVISETERFS